MSKTSEAGQPICIIRHLAGLAGNGIAWTLCFGLAILAALGLLGLATALSGLIRAMLWIPAAEALIALGLAIWLRRRGRRCRVIGSTVAVISIGIMAGLLGCAVLAPWTTEEVRIDAAGHTLAGTVYLPKGEPPFPAVVLIHGSTRQTRNSLGGLYRSNAALFARNGYAAIVYDKRGCGASGGDFDSALMSDFSEDARAVVEYLACRDDIDPTRIGLWGISAGGWVAPLVARDNELVRFLILASSPVVPESEQRLFEWAKLIRADGASEAYITNAIDMRRRIWRYYATGDRWRQLSDELENARNKLWWSSIQAVFPDGVKPPDVVNNPTWADEFRWQRTDCF